MIETGFYLSKLGSHLKRVRNQVIETFTKKWLFDGKSFLEFFNQSFPEEYLRKKKYLETKKNKEYWIFFSFRITHFIDWFVPIHLALENLYPGRYKFIYLNYATTRNRIGNGLDYIEFKKKLEERLLSYGISPMLHFSHEEISSFENFPQADMIFTSESIRYDQEKTRHRVYLPHYSLPKAKDSLPENIRYNHVFIPSKAGFSYHGLDDYKNPDVTLHQVGYPKMHIQAKTKKLFNNNNPVIIYAPTLEKNTQLDAIKDGILKLFKKLTGYNFIIKLHPSLASANHYIGNFIKKEIQNYSNIKIDSMSSIQELAPESNLMITDFGSIGAEYKLGFGKRIIYLKVPTKLENGADLIFRDRFADQICSIENLEESIQTELDKGDLTKEEKYKIGEEVLYEYGEADLQTAKLIEKILNNK